MDGGCPVDLQHGVTHATRREPRVSQRHTGHQLGRGRPAESERPRSIVAGARTLPHTDLREGQLSEECCELGHLRPGDRDGAAQELNRQGR